MPKSHWSYELDFGSHQWMPDALRHVGVDPAVLAPMTSGAAIEFATDEAEVFTPFVETLLTRLLGSDFMIAWPGRVGAVHRPPPQAALVDDDGGTGCRLIWRRSYPRETNVRAPHHPGGRGSVRAVVIEPLTAARREARPPYSLSTQHSALLPPTSPPSPARPPPAPSSRSPRPPSPRRSSRGCRRRSSRRACRCGSRRRSRRAAAPGRVSGAGRSSIASSRRVLAPPLAPGDGTRSSSSRWIEPSAHCSRHVPFQPVCGRGAPVAAVAERHAALELQQHLQARVVPVPRPRAAGSSWPSPARCCGR